jgi:hypothetical protein
MRAQFVNEVGEDRNRALPFEYRGEIAGFLHRYVFETANEKYIVNLYPPRLNVKRLKDDYVVDFISSKAKDFDEVTNKGDFFKIVPTVIAIMKEFYKTHKVRKFIFNEVSSYKGDRRRFDIFRKISERNIPPDWKIKASRFFNKIVLIPSGKPLEI